MLNGYDGSSTRPDELVDKVNSGLYGLSVCLLERSYGNCLWLNNLTFIIVLVAGSSR